MMKKGQEGKEVKKQRRSEQNILKRRNEQRSCSWARVTVPKSFLEYLDLIPIPDGWQGSISTQAVEKASSLALCHKHAKAHSSDSQLLIRREVRLGVIFLNLLEQCSSTDSSYVQQRSAARLLPERVLFPFYLYKKKGMNKL